MEGGAPSRGHADIAQRTTHRHRHTKRHTQRRVDLCVTALDSLTHMPHPVCTPHPPLHPRISQDSLRVEGVFVVESSPEARLSPTSKTRSLRGGGGPGGSPSYPSGSTSDRVGGGGWPDRGRPAFDWGDREEESRSARPGSTPPSEWILGRAASTCSAGCAPPPFTSCPYRVI